MSILASLSRFLLGSKGNTLKQEQPAIIPDAGNTKTVGELQDKPMSSWGNSDIIECLRFSATLQLRNSLRILLRHDEIHSDPNTAPPIIALEGWEGIWMASVNRKPFQGYIASHAGPVLAKDYLPFLIAIRQVVEAQDSIERRVENLSGMHFKKDWQTYLDKLGGIERIINQFFPDFISSIPGLSRVAAQELKVLGLSTPNKLASTSDKTLLGIKGIGPSKLLKIRDYCAGIIENRDSDREDKVIR